MATSFPTALDVLPDPGAATGTADPGFYHDVMHSNANDAISAVQQKLGITNSPVTSTVDYIQHHHQHTGIDGSAKIQQYNAQPSVDGPVITALSAAALQVFQVSSATAGPVVSVTPQAAASAGMVIKGLSSQSGDLLTFQNSTGQAIAGATANGTLYSSSGLQLTKGVGGNIFLNTNNPTGEMEYLNGAILRGYSGAYTGAGGAGEMFHLDAGQGFLKLGGAAGVAELQLNAFNTARSTSLELHGKDNADSGLTIFREYVDADGQVATSRSYLLRGNLGKTATGALIGEDTFMAASYPSYDGNTTYTKSVGISVQPGVAPTLTAGAVTVSGNQTVTGNTTVQGSLAVTGATTFSTAITVPGLTNTGNATIGGTLGVTGATTLAALSATTITATGTSSLAAVTATSLQANVSGLTGRYVGGAPVNPALTFNAGDFASQSTSPVGVWVCTVGGTPGTWSPASTRQLIERQVLGAAVATVTFSTIPQIYENLIIEIMGRHTQANTGNWVIMRFNGDAGTTNYISQTVYGSGVTTSAANLSAGTAGMEVVFLPGASDTTANQPGHGRITIPAYARTTFTKVYSSECAGATAWNTTNSLYTLLASGNWNSTAAITSITFANIVAGNFVAGSVFSLYGEL